MTLRLVGTGKHWEFALQGRVLGRWWTILTFEPRYGTGSMIGNCVEELRRRLNAMRAADLWEEAT